MNRGQIPVMQIVSWGLILAIAAVGTFSASSIRTDSKLEGVNNKVSGQGERITAVETKIPDIDRRLTNIEKDTKDILLEIKRINGK